MKRLTIMLLAVAPLLAGCESAPPQGPHSLLEQTTTTDQFGTRVDKPAYLVPQAPPR